MPEIEIIIAPGPDLRKSLDFALVTLTEAIGKVYPDALGCGLMWGPHDYGADFSNGVFEMQTQKERDCTCPGDERERAWNHEPSCEFSIPNFHHRRTGFKVWWYKHIGRSTEVQNIGDYDLQAIFNECLASLRK